MPRLTIGGHRDLEKYYPLMQMDFDSEELISKLALHKAMTLGSARFHILKDEESGMDLGYAFVVTKNVYGYVLLKYFGVLPWYRGKGVGIEAMRQLHRTYADAQGIVAEITDFPDSDPDHQKKLKKFFRRFGYEEKDCVDYKISGTDGHIFVKPIKASVDVGPYINRIIFDFYSGIINRAAIDRMISIGKKVPESE